jgi:hypothetical protein
MEFIKIFTKLVTGLQVFKANFIYIICKYINGCFQSSYCNIIFLFIYLFFGQRHTVALRLKAGIAEPE